MLNFINGTVQSVESNSLSIIADCLGFSIYTPYPAQFKKGFTVSLYLHMHWSTDAGPSLYGFTSLFDRSVFLLMISCSGVGPKLACAAIADLGALAFVQAVHENTPHILSSINGVGKKKAEQIIIQLRDKVDVLLRNQDGVKGKVISTHWFEIEQVLASLNYSRSEITKAISQLKEIPEHATLSFDQLMRQALSLLVKKI